MTNHSTKQIQKKALPDTTVAGMPPQPFPKALASVQNSLNLTYSKFVKKTNSGVLWHMLQATPCPFTSGTTSFKLPALTIDKRKDNQVS